MSDSTAPSEGNTDVSGENTGGFKPVTSQEDLDRIIENRLVRERKKFADLVSHSHFKKCEKPHHSNKNPATSTRQRGKRGDGGNRTPVRRPAPRSSPGASCY